MQRRHRESNQGCVYIFVDFTNRYPCAFRHARHGVPHKRDAERPNYAVQHAYRDSVEQARVGKFIAEYQQRARAFQIGGNYLGQIQLLRCGRASLVQPDCER